MVELEVTVVESLLAMRCSVRMCQIAYIPKFMGSARRDFRKSRLDSLLNRPFRLSSEHIEKFQSKNKNKNYVKTSFKYDIVPNMTLCKKLFRAKGDLK